MDSVSVRWVDLGTRLVLRHVVKIVGAAGGSQRNSNNGGDNEEQHREEGEGAEAGDSGERVATIEVDLMDIRWAECTEGEQEPREDESPAKKLAGGEKYSRNSGSAVVVRKADQAVMELQQEEKERVEALINERRAEDKATRIAKEAEVSRVSSRTWSRHFATGVVSCTPSIE